MNPSETLTARSPAALPLAGEDLAVTTRSIWHDAMLLGKPRITAMVMLTVALGFLLAPGGTAELGLLIHTLIGVGLVAAASGILNQAWERDTDALMRRTWARPMPMGRISPAVGYALGLTLGTVGVIWLVAEVNAFTAALSILTLAGYVLIYTPLKRVTAWNTLVGAIPGAMPPLLGYAAAAQALPLESWILFGILFLWQFPHFFAIAWMHREDYQRGGLVMVSTVDRWNGKLTGWLTLGTSVVLLAFSLVPFAVGLNGYGYLSGALVLGGLFCWASGRFLVSPSREAARRTLWASLLYLPVVFLLLIVNGLRA
jgi:protoheme IX farnesyltransferase